MPFVLILLPTTGRGRRVCREVTEAGSLKAVGEGLNLVTDPYKGPTEPGQKRSHNTRRGDDGCEGASATSCVPTVWQAQGTTWLGHQGQMISSTPQVADVSEESAQEPKR